MEHMGSNDGDKVTELSHIPAIIKEYQGDNGEQHRSQASR